jgi:hypothetical protein
MKWASSEMKTNSRKARNRTSEPHGLSSIDPHTCRTRTHATHTHTTPTHNTRTRAGTHTHTAHAHNVRAIEMSETLNGG